jgi:hypothetical protein
MADAVKIQILGMREFRRALKAADAQLPRELRRVFNTAARAVVEEAVPRMPERSGNLKRSVRARSTSNEGRVVSGTPGRVPYAGWIEFGGRRRGRGNSYAVRDVVREGRYLYPAFVRRQLEVLQAMEEALRNLQRQMEGR